MAPKTKEYTRRAVDKYREGKDILSLTLEKGTRERIENATEKKAPAWIREVIEKELSRIESGSDHGGRPADDPQDPKNATWESLQKQYFE